MWSCLGVDGGAHLNVGKGTNKGLTEQEPRIDRGKMLDVGFN